MSLFSVLAFDFDGVVCNGLREYFQTSWQVYSKIWGHDRELPSRELENAFGRLRPVVETGWEMPILIHALQSGFTETNILSDWSNIALELLHHHGLTPLDVGQVVDEVRDRWIEEDLERWLSLHDFYPGMIDYLKSLDHFVIISTKEARFIQALLDRHGVDLEPSQIYGKERQRPKYETLLELLPNYSHITFIEDRLKTLQTIAIHAELDSVKLLFADWGYSLPKDHDLAQKSDRIQLVTLPEFLNT